ncbi:hypothetical protein CROQUDRAFT_653303 [Cronartium quercuum f. sp. fusiforme G11]|uniref:Zn(2)-C6 fungal-type domain-containing protein n=1 Tax=Cronartium quercuum f. sp. fusiforme G11 TaxID=708437 RepID=A0A9P6NUF5_9BASI|nr:hypothetical protein CROQUDRAFT_653303 [Cronartium quercuum f. sp. fusiforme G11]
MPKEPSQKPKQTRKRIPRTCAQCRKRKQKCDSLKPCAVCKLRGEADLCDYEGAQPTRVLDENDVINTPISPAELSRLRQQLDGLEALVSSVVHKRPLVTSSGPEADSPTVDLEEYNVAATLSSIMLSRTVLPVIGQDPPIVEKVRRQCRLSNGSSPNWTKGSNHPGLLSSYFPSPVSADQIADLHRKLPTYEQAQQFLKIYVSEFAWYHACFNQSAYEADAQKLYHCRELGPHQTGEDATAHRLITMATTYAIARMAIMKLSFQQATQLELPVGVDERTNLSKQWLDASVTCLKCADFEGDPRLESIICLIILLEALWFDERFGGLEDLAELFELKCKAMNLAFDLALHRDPSQRDPSRMNEMGSDKAHERRVLWWALMSIDGLYSGPAGRMSSINGLEAVDVFLPALSGLATPNDAHEGCESGCTASTPVMGVKPRLLMGYVAYEIARLPLRRNPMPTINDVLQAHRDLTSLEAHLPETHKLFVTGHITDRSRLPVCSRARRDAMYFYTRYHFLVVKLHRPMHTVKRDESQPSSPPFDIAYHRKFVVDHALLLLDLRRIRNPSPDYLDANMMALSASFSLALDYLFDPQTEEAPYIKDELEQFVAFLKLSKSPLIHRGLQILQCVMSTWGTPPPPGTTWFAAFEGPVSPTSWAQGPFHQPLDLSFAGPATTNNLEGFGAGPNQAFSSLKVFQTIDLPESPLLAPHSTQLPTQPWMPQQTQDAVTQSISMPRRQVPSMAEQPPHSASTSSVINSHRNLPPSLSQYHPESVDPFSPSGSTASLPQHPHNPNRYSISGHSVHEPDSPHGRFFPGSAGNHAQATYHPTLALPHQGYNPHLPRTDSRGHAHKHPNQNQHQQQHHRQQHQHQHQTSPQHFQSDHSFAGHPGDTTYPLATWPGTHDIDGWRVELE